MKATHLEELGSDLKREDNRIVMATLNVNGLYAFRQDSRTRSLLRPYGVRFRALGKLVEASDIDVINFQEVFTHRQRKLLEASLPSFGYTTYESAMTGPRGALVTFSRIPIEKVSYESFRSVSKAVDHSGLPRFVLAKSSLKGILVSRLKDSSLAIVNTHPLANYDWDWSPDNRFHSLEEVQLGKIADVIHYLRANGYRIALGADLNVAKSSGLFRTFLARTGLHDAFEGDESPTFNAEFVAGGRKPECIDYLLASDHIGINGSYRLFEGKVDVEGDGAMYLTDHDGLCAGLMA